MKKETALFRNSAKTRKLFVTSGIICIILLAFFLYSLGLFDGEFKTKPAVVSGAVLLVMLFLLFKSLAGIRDKSPRILLTETHFSGKTTPLSKAFGEGEWRDVKNIALQKVGGDTLVVVSLGNTAKYAGRLSKMFWNMAYNEPEQVLNLMYSASEIDLGAQELYKIFIDHWEESKRKGNASV